MDPSLSQTVSRILGVDILRSSRCGGGCDADAYEVVLASADSDALQNSGIPFDGMIDEDGRGSSKASKRARSGSSSSNKNNGNASSSKISPRIFVKVDKTGGVTGGDSLQKFQAEAAGLQAIAGTGTIRAPRPILAERLVDGGGSKKGGAFLAMEFIQLFDATKGSDAVFGRKLAEMHAQPPAKHAGSVVGSFGFPMLTWCGAGPQQNDWRADWLDFYREFRLREHMRLIESQQGKDAKLREAVEDLCKPGVLEKLFKGGSGSSGARDGRGGGAKAVTPSLLHGDLWSGNWACDNSGNPVVFDPSVYYGHHEAELSIMTMFGSPSRAFFEAYHAVLPRAEPHFETRQKLYQLFHYLNHYLIFGGGGYRGSCVRIVKDLLE